MVREIERDNGVYYECEGCKLLYKEKCWATKCQEWCSKNKSCNLEITKHAIKESNNKKA